MTYKKIKNGYLFLNKFNQPLSYLRLVNILNLSKHTHVKDKLVMRRLEKGQHRFAIAGCKNKKDAIQIISCLIEEDL